MARLDWFANWFVVVAASHSAVAQTLAEAQARYRGAGDSADRMSALEVIAGVSPDESADAVAITEALARGLTAKDSAVRVHAIELLANKGPDRGAALDALRDYCDVVAKQLQQMTDKKRKAMVDINFPNFEGSKSQAEYLRKMSAGQKRLKDARDSLGLKVATADPMIAALAGVFDDRAIDGLLALFKVRPSSGPILTALMEYKTRKVLAAICARVVPHDKGVKERKQKLKKAVHQRPSRPPKYWRGTKDAWKEREEQRIAVAVETQESYLVQVQKARATVFDEVRAYAVRHMIAGVPKGNDSRALVVWQRRAAKSLPVTLSVVEKR